jgi:hypothetical protein
MAERVADWWTRVLSAVESELYAHYNAGRDAGVSDLPDIAKPSDVRAHITLLSVEVRPYRSVEEFQVAIRTEWDDEHTLGALVRDATLVGLNGSILEPR